MSASITLELGGQQYEIAQPPYGRARDWRKRFEAEVTPVVAAMDTLQGLNLAAVATAPLDQIAALIFQLGPTLLGAPDLIAELVLAYAPALAQDRAQLETTANDPEFFRAFGKILGQMYPLGILMESLGGMSRGTSPSLRVPRGARTPTA